MKLLALAAAWVAGLLLGLETNVNLAALASFSLAALMLCVGNQHKWDRLGPEKVIIMKSCVGAP